MRILLVGDCDPGIKKAFEDCGQEVVEHTGKLVGNPEQLGKKIKAYCPNSGNAAVFTFDFYPLLAEACKINNVLYISWVWDCPHLTLWSATAKYETNRIFVFDCSLFERLRQRKIENVWHLPLAVDVNTFQDTIKKDAGRSARKYGKDVAFVGNLYNDSKKAMLDNVKYLPPHLKGYLDAIIDVQRKIWGVDLVMDALSPEIWKTLKEYIIMDLGDAYQDDIYEMMVVDMIHKKISQLERMELCSVLARLFNFSLYTGSDTSYDSVIKNCGRVDYRNEMPLVFHYSKINIHITTRAIPSGIPQRVLDVLACEGFLLTNYQPEIAEYFEDGKELVMYESFEDLCAKIDYYLKHDEEREQIAHAGFEKVKDYFGYHRQVGCMLKLMDIKDECR